MSATFALITSMNTISDLFIADLANKVLSSTLKWHKEISIIA